MRARWAAAAAALTLATAALAGCGGSDGGATSASADAATIRTAEISGFGTVVADRGSKPLYVITSDPDGKSTCTGSCLGDFAPAEAGDELSAGPGLEAGDLMTADGQLVYAGHPLYTYGGEGLISGAGEKSGSGTWYLLSAKGEPIKTSAAGGY